MLEESRLYFKGNYWAKYVFNSHYTNTPFVLFHEALGSFGQWKDFPEKLSQLFKAPVFIWERTGYGASDQIKKERDLNYLHEAAEDWAAIHAIFMEHKAYHLIGHSDGASIALIFAAQKNRELLKSLVLMAPHVIVEDITLSGISPAIEAYEAGKLKGLEQYHGNKTDTLFYAWAHTWLKPEFKDWNILDVLPYVDVPCCVIQGSADQYGSYEQLNLIKQGIRGKYQELWLNDIGHHPHLESAEQVLTGLQEFYGNQHQ